MENNNYLSKESKVIRWTAVLSCCLLLFFFASSVKAQTVTNYAFAATSGTYTSISGTGTVLLGNSATANDDGVSAATPIGFNFIMNGKVYSHFAACVNGWVRLGQIHRSAVQTQHRCLQHIRIRSGLPPIRNCYVLCGMIFISWVIQVTRWFMQYQELLPTVS